MVVDVLLKTSITEARDFGEELFAQLKDVVSENGFTLSNCIQTGVETPHLQSKSATSFYQSKKHMFKR